MTPRGAAALAAIGATCLALGVAGRVRNQNAPLRAQVVRVCACGDEVVARVRRLARSAPSPLDAALDAQARLVNAGCGDLQHAVRARGALDALRARPLRVAPTVEHDRASRAMREALRALCDPALDARWTADPQRDPRGIVRDAVTLAIVNEMRRIRVDTCARRAILGAQPETYRTTLAELERSTRGCSAPRR